MTKTQTQHPQETAPKHYHVYRGPLYAYVTGFVLSLLLTFTAFMLVIGSPLFSKDLLFISLGLLAFIQFVVQLVFFLHLAREAKPRWHLFVFALTVSVVLIIVIGSIWIMYHLNSRMMPSSQEMQTYMHNEAGM
jgi:cytochrome o ubiquinol oxidase operon protein cyoD